jgi:hypothetical protein
MPNVVFTSAGLSDDDILEALSCNDFKMAVSSGVSERAGSFTFVLHVALAKPAKTSHSRALQA